MEATNLPHTSGFSRKPNRKFKRIPPASKHTKKHRILTPKEIEQAKCLGGMLFLIYAAKQIAGLFSDSSANNQKSL